jgi:thermitase
LFSDDLESKGLEIKESFSNLDNLALVEIKDDKSVEDVVKMLNNDPNVEYAEPNYIRYLFSNNDSISTNDPYKSQQWALEFIDWPEAYNVYS